MHWRYFVLAKHFVVHGTHVTVAADCMLFCLWLVSKCGHDFVDKHGVSVLLMATGHKCVCVFPRVSARMCVLERDLRVASARDVEENSSHSALGCSVFSSCHPWTMLWCSNVGSLVFWMDFPREMLPAVAVQSSQQKSCCILAAPWITMQFCRLCGSGALQLMFVGQTFSMMANFLCTAIPLGWCPGLRRRCGENSSWAGCLRHILA